MFGYEDAVWVPFSHGAHPNLWDWYEILPELRTKYEAFKVLLAAHCP